MLAIVNWSIASRERLLADGRTVFLELAPVDPRSMMQGDYMALRFAVEREIDLSQPGGRLVAKVDARSVATFARRDDGSPIAADEIRIRYRVRNGTVKFATNAFFFEEGTADRYDSARYGEFKVDADGELLLTGLRDRNLNPLGATAQ
jgi:uncharacterized membrane-anchored protein